MSIGIRITLVVLGIFAALFGLQIAASESGEVVVVTTNDAGSGASHSTRVWVVDHDAHAWIRAGAPGAAWFKRLTGSPTIQVRRGAITQTYIAVPEPGARAMINALYAAKYGWADGLVGIMVDHRASVPIRLDPVPPAQSPSPPRPD